MNEKIRVIIAEDQQSYRDGIRSFLQLKNIDVIAEAANGQELLDLIIIRGLRPDVILLDVDMPVMDGNEALIKLRKFNTDIKIIMLTLYKNDDLVVDLKGNGANCFFSKDTGLTIIADAIRKLIYNDRYSNISEKTKSIFTKVEIEILQFLRQGKTTSEIAKLRGKSVKSIEAHRKKMYEKAGATNAAEFSEFSTKSGLHFVKHKSIN